MTPELERILNRIGFQRAKTYNPSPFFVSSEQSLRGSLLFADKPSARDGVEEMEAILKRINHLPKHLREALDGALRSPEDWDNDRSPLLEFENALEVLLEEGIKEKSQYWTGRGASPKVSANQVASTMAEIYVIGLGKMPTEGEAYDSGEPSTKFSKTVRDVFEHINLRAHFREPCRRAIKELKENDKEKFHRLLEIRSRKGRPGISLITGRRKLPKI
ncbi:hypothetical protein DDZ14_17885 [Maritimibacter sp. 55A14]|uniref:hypothetical protein n=1 Tax=Maritimibacter sp. 55A14 TaxID=2174844 RepID=UPI000D615348|nr:hypothetical protein [Maritimibacter sp. 55A14]PWE29244.1 hypothetical protein DDZ14_17885 [Maritimibacter sp. 55A14]